MPACLLHRHCKCTQSQYYVHARHISTPVLDSAAHRCKARKARGPSSTIANTTSTRCRLALSDPYVEMTDCGRHRGLAVSEALAACCMGRKPDLVGSPRPARTVHSGSHSKRATLRALPDDDALCLECVHWRGTLCEIQGRSTPAVIGEPVVKSVQPQRTVLSCLQHQR